MVSYSHFTVFKHLHITSDSSIPETRKHCDYMHFVMTNPINHKSLNSDHWLSRDRKSTRLNSSHGYISYAVFCLKKKKHVRPDARPVLHLRRTAFPVRRISSRGQIGCETGVCARTNAVTDPHAPTAHREARVRPC